MVLVWPIPLPESIDTGIGNTFRAQNYSILFSNTFAKIQTSLNFPSIISVHLRSVATSLARVLDVLQGEMVAGLGYLLPTLCVCIIKSQLLELLDHMDGRY